MYIVTAKEMYEIDRFAMEDIGISGSLLMENAGRAVAEKAKSLFNKQDKVLILCGSGNNGGDGYVIARTLLNEGFQAAVLQVGRSLKGNAALHQQLYTRMGGEILDMEQVDAAAEIGQADVIIDAMLGLGVNGPLRDPYSEMVDAVNRSSARVISVDIPSGIPADNAVNADTAVQADYTFIIEAPKPSVFVQKTASYYGQWETAAIGLPVDYLRRRAAAEIWSAHDVKNTLPMRQPFSHKGSHGKGLVIGGGKEMPGSVTMAGMGALRAGAGLITVGTLEQVIPAVMSHLTEATFSALPEKDGVLKDTEALDLSPYDGIIAGMGMGRSKDTAELTKHVLREAEVPVLLDADGLYHVKEDLSLLKERKAPTVMTPHPGEMAMLLDIEIPKLLANPFELTRQFAQEHGIYLVFKGTYTIVTSPDGSQRVNLTGNPGLGKGGSGDVLSGMLLAMMMQHEQLFDALANGVFIHGKAADVMVESEHSQHDLLATDLMKGLAAVFRTFSN